MLNDSSVGKAIMNDSCKNVHIVNEMDIPILAMGLQNIVISASSEGILVADKRQSSYIKPFIEEFERQLVFAEKKWGSYKIVDSEDKFLITKLTINEGLSINYCSHETIDEIWIVLQGFGRILGDDFEQDIKSGCVITMKAGRRHTLFAKTELKLIEIQFGETMGMADKEKIELE